MLGGLVSLLVARWTLQGIAALLPPDAADDVAVPRAAAGDAVRRGARRRRRALLFGLFPALHSTRA